MKLSCGLDALLEAGGNDGVQRAGAGQREGDARVTLSERVHRPVHQVSAAKLAALTGTGHLRNQKDTDRIAAA